MNKKAEYARGGGIKRNMIDSEARVKREAMARKDGGQVVAKKDGGKVPELKSGGRLDKYARGGRAGADKNPFSSAKC